MTDRRATRRAWFNGLHARGGGGGGPRGRSTRRACRGRLAGQNPPRKMQSVKRLAVRHVQEFALPILCASAKWNQRVNGVLVVETLGQRRAEVNKQVQPGPLLVIMINSVCESSGRRLKCTAPYTLEDCPFFSNTFIVNNHVKRQKHCG